MKSKNLFFSYYYKNSTEYNRLIEMLGERKYFGYSNSSLDEESSAENEDYIKTKIRLKIDWSGTIVVLIGPGTYTRKYVDYEIEYARKKDKRIVGVYLLGKSQSKLPVDLRKAHNEDYKDIALVRWNLDSIVSAIRETNTWDEGD
jgi:hypothetical protein